MIAPSEAPWRPHPFPTGGVSLLPIFPIRCCQNNLKTTVQEKHSRLMTLNSGVTQGLNLGVTQGLPFFDIGHIST